DWRFCWGGGRRTRAFGRLLRVLLASWSRLAIFVFAGPRIVWAEPILEETARLWPGSSVLVLVPGLILLIPEELGFRCHAGQLGYRQNGCRNQPAHTQFARHFNSSFSIRFREQLVATALIRSSSRRRKRAASRRAVREYLRVSRMSVGTESGLAPKQRFAGIWLRIRIVPDRSCYRCLRQPVAFSVPIDRDGHTSRTIYRARQRANDAGDQAAQNDSCRSIL